MKIITFVFLILSNTILSQSTRSESQFFFMGVNIGNNFYKYQYLYYGNGNSGYYIDENEWSIQFDIRTGYQYKRLKSEICFAYQDTPIDPRFLIQGSLDISFNILPKDVINQIFLGPKIGMGYLIPIVYSSRYKFNNRFPLKTGLQFSYKGLIVESFFNFRKSFDYIDHPIYKRGLTVSFGYQFHIN